MGFVRGLSYNLRGLAMAFKNPKLLALGLARFIVVILLTTVSAGLILYHHQDILQQIWSKPESLWIIWLWYVVSWLLSLLLAGLAVILAYIISQLLFAVVVMDAMSRITERLVAGKERIPPPLPLVRQFFFLARQEIPRSTIPVLAALLIMVLGWLTPLGPFLTILAPVVAVVFLAWDNTDLVPARRLQRFSERFNFLLDNLPFHIGFGLPFLVPGLNILLLSFAPVGATLFYLEHHNRQP